MWFFLLKFKTVSILFKTIFWGLMESGEKHGPTELTELNVTRLFHKYIQILESERFSSRVYIFGSWNE